MMTLHENNNFDGVLSEIALDHRIIDGIFRLEENIHMEVFREYFINKGIAESLVVEFSNKVLEGKYPERQAYNAKGILVTFPTPEYKADAIKRGTHFEENPIKKSSNLFSDSPTASDQSPTTVGSTVPPPPTAPPQDKKPVASSDKPIEEPKTNLPVSQAMPPATLEPPPQVKTTAAPEQTPSSTIPTDPEKDHPEQDVEKSDEEREADKNAIKSMLRGDNYMLERMARYVINHKDVPFYSDIIKEARCGFTRKNNL